MTGILFVRQAALLLGLTFSLMGCTTSHDLWPAFPPPIDDLEARSAAATKAMLSAYGEGDMQGFLFYFAFESISLPPEHIALVGRGALHTRLLALKKQGLRIRRFALQDQRIWLAGHRHYQVARYQVDHTLPGQKEIVHAFYSGLTVRERQSDGVFRIKLTAYNQTAAPAKRSDLGYSAPWGQGGVEVCPTLHGMPLPEDYLIEEIQEIEEAFYVFLVDGQTQRAARCYADDATLIVQGQPVHQGKEAVGRALIRESGAAAPITGVEREILQLEGDERMVYVVSQLRWAMRDPNTGDPFVTEGKGVHVWQRQADYSWKLLVDVTNRDGPSDE